MSAKGELRDGDTGSRTRIEAAADVAVSRTLALLARQELADERRLDLSGGDIERGNRRTILGMAMRPTDDDASTRSSSWTIGWTRLPCSAPSSPRLPGTNASSAPPT